MSDKKRKALSIFGGALVLGFVVSIGAARQPRAESPEEPGPIPAVATRVGSDLVRVAQEPRGMRAESSVEPASFRSSAHSEESEERVSHETLAKNRIETAIQETLLGSEFRIEEFIEACGTLLGSAQVQTEAELEDSVENGFFAFAVDGVPEGAESQLWVYPSSGKPERTYSFKLWIDPPQSPWVYAGAVRHPAELTLTIVRDADRNPVRVIATTLMGVLEEQTKSQFDTQLAIPVGAEYRIEFAGERRTQLRKIGWLNGKMGYLENWGSPSPIYALGECSPNSLTLMQEKLSQFLSQLEAKHANL